MIYATILYSFGGEFLQLSRDKGPQTLQRQKLTRLRDKRGNDLQTQCIERLGAFHGLPRRALP